MVVENFTTRKFCFFVGLYYKVYSIFNILKT